MENTNLIQQAHLLSRKLLLNIAASSEYRKIYLKQTYLERTNCPADTLRA